jgi:CRP-like cAMP-binding protein/HEAT repeat protein
MARNQAGNLFDTLVKTLSDEHYVDFFSEINRINENRSYAQKPLTDEERNQFSSVLSLLKKNDKTRKLREEIKEKILSEKKRIALDRVHQQKGINRILQGDHAPLADPLVMDAITDRIALWQRSGKDDQARNLIDKIADGLLDGSLKTRSLASSSLLAIGEMFLADNRSDELTRLSQRLNLWIRFETEVTFNYKAACQMLQDHARRLLGAYQFTEANAILETFSFIAYGKLKKNDEIREMAASVLRSIATEKTFKLIFDEFKDNAKEQGKNAFYTLIRLGDIAVVPLLDLLRASEAMSQRVRIINALTEIGKPCLPKVVERLKLGQSWFYLRNLIKLLSELGSEDHLEILKPLLAHDNEKIPRAALNCAFDIGGNERAKFFIQALSLSDSGLRRLAADLLGKTGSEEGVFPLTQILKSKGDSSEAKHELDLIICEALKRIGSKKAVPVLTSIVTQKGLLGISAYGSELRQAATATLKHLQSLPTRSEKTELKASESPVEDQAPARKKKKTDDFLTADPARLEALVDEYVRQKNTSEAVRLLFNMTVRFAREKNFAKAEALREKLFEVDPMALSEIVRTGDIIEQEKANALINDYMNIWGNLYDRLTSDEANDLFYSVKAVEFPPDETIIAQHEMNNRLYFINRGQLKIVHTQDGNEYFLKMLGAGDIAGDDTFFSATVSTVSLITLSQVKVGFLDREALKGLSVKYPQLEDKLRSFCALGDGVNTLVAKLGLERRRQERLNVKGKTLVQLLDPVGKPMGNPFKGNLLDLSVGGVAFMIKANRKETTRLLLGRKLNMAIGIQAGGAPIQVSGVGTIISAREREDAYVSLHLKFDKTMDDETMAGITDRMSRTGSA